MEAQFEKIGLEAERLAATTPDAIDAEDIAPRSMEEIEQGLTPIEIAISISHFRAWRHMLDRGERRMLVMEDDVLLSPLLPSFLAALEAEGRDFELLRLETRGSPVRFNSRPDARLHGIALHRPLSYEAGSGAYIVSAPYALRILRAQDRFDGPHDDILSSTKSPFPNRARMWTTVPALALSPSASSPAVPENILASDAEASRAARRTTHVPPAPVKTTGLKKARREIWRAGQLVAKAYRWVALGERTKRMSVPFAGDGLTEPRSAARQPA